MAARVVHVRREPYDGYIARAARGLRSPKRANPFKVRGGNGTRDEVTAMYKEYLRDSS